MQLPAKRLGLSTARCTGDLATPTARGRRVGLGKGCPHSHTAASGVQQVVTSEALVLDRFLGSGPSTTTQRTWRSVYLIARVPHSKQVGARVTRCIHLERPPAQLPNHRSTRPDTRVHLHPTSRRHDGQCIGVYQRPDLCSLTFLPVARLSMFRRGAPSGFTAGAATRAVRPVAPSPWRPPDPIRTPAHHEPARHDRASMGGRRLVPHSRLVRLASRSGASDNVPVSDLDLAREAVHEALPHRTQGVRTADGGEHGQRVRMSVMGRDEPIARELHERFGDLVELKVAWQPYPLPASPPAPAPAPQRQPNTARHGAQIRTMLDEPFRRSVERGRIVTGHIEIRNNSDERITWSSDSTLDADVCSADGTVMNLRNAHGRGTGKGVNLAPGATAEMPFVASTDSRDARLGRVLPPGHYQLFVAIPVYGDAAGEVEEITCPSVTINVK